MGLGQRFHCQTRNYKGFIVLRCRWGRSQLAPSTTPTSRRCTSSLWRSCSSSCRQGQTYPRPTTRELWEVVAGPCYTRDGAWQQGLACYKHGAQLSWSRIVVSQTHAARALACTSRVLQARVTTLSMMGPPCLSFSTRRVAPHPCALSHTSHSLPEHAAARPALPSHPLSSQWL